MQHPSNKCPMRHFPLALNTDNDVRYCIPIVFLYVFVGYGMIKKKHILCQKLSKSTALHISCTDRKKLTKYSRVPNKRTCMLTLILDFLSIFGKYLFKV